MVLYWANLSPHKKEDSAGRQSGSQRACYVLAKRMGKIRRKKQSDWQIRQEREHLWITGSCNKREGREKM